MSFGQRLKYLLPSYRRAQESDMNEELQSLAAIAGPGELGNLTRVAEEARAVWSWTWLEQLYRDVQYAVRTMRHNIGFTATVVLSLALGIGANTAIFSLMDALMLRWLPVSNPQELVQLKLRSGRAGAHGGESFSNAIVAALAEQKDIFSNVCGFSGAVFDVGPRGSVSRLPGAWVTGGYYETLGLNPVLGRLLEPADDRPGAPLVAVISYGYWERQFASNPDVIGRSIPVDGVPVTIAGVSPRGFQGANVGAAANLTMATAALPRLEPASAALLSPGNFWLSVLARPHAGVPVLQSQAHLSAVWPQISERVISTGWPAFQRKEMAESTFELAPGGTGYTYLRERFRTPLVVLMAVTALVLLIACANAASLLLARASARQREISVRLAIGAGRGRIIRQLLTESTFLSLLGAGLGVFLAWITSRFLLDILAGGGHSAGPSAIAFDLTPNWHVLGFASAVAIANGILFGLAPAVQTTAMGGSRVLKDDTRITRARSRLLSSLVTAQVALSLLLLVGAGLFARTLQNLLNVDPGFRREGVLLVDLDGQREGYSDARLMAFYRGLLDRVRQVPGVVSASISSHTPLSGATWTEAVVPKGQPVPERDNAIFIAAGPGFFGTMQTPLISGRDFDERDQGSPNVAIVNQAFVARYYQSRNPVGQYLSATVTRPPSDLQIVGVVKDVTTRSLRLPPRPTVYVSYFQRTPRADSLVIRVAGSFSQAASAIRKELQPSFPNTALDVLALDDQVGRTLVQERLLANVAGGFGVLGLALACVGLYGLLGYSVVRRTKEIGIRMALGAQQRGVLWMIGGRALRLVAVGVALGLPMAWVASRWLRSMLFGLTPMDLSVIAGAVVLLGMAGMLAAYFPAKRATRVDPTTALRHE
jgi:putative ABC transport system permease protein